ncbi:MAG: hypothetical protein EXR81_04545, partial [Gammaproteobacteria bacterium]|nr:hypothetical protein [Gammaproteobacteria bacterium]
MYAQLKESIPFQMADNIAQNNLHIWARLQCHHVPKEKKAFTVLNQDFLFYKPEDHSRYIATTFSNTQWGSITKKYIELRARIHDDSICLKPKTEVEQFIVAARQEFDKTISTKY